jgi:phospholipid/cholesterol/gamma-HCH transport system substrate-binding protein
MQSNSSRDFIVGLFVVAGLAAIAYLSVQVGGLSYTGPGGLRLVGSFDEVGGLTERAPVTIAGVKVGTVQSIELDEDLRARVSIDVDAALELPVDTAAGIRTAGLLGDQFIALEPGAEDLMLQNGDEFEFTESAINLDKLIGAVVHGGIGGE